MRDDGNLHFRWRLFPVAGVMPLAVAVAVAVAVMMSLAGDAQGQEPQSPGPAGGSAAAGTEVVQDDDVPGGEGQGQEDGTAGASPSIAELAMRLLSGGDSPVRRPFESGQSFSYDPDPELLDHRTQELLSSLGDRRLSLLEAIAVTLERAPEIKLAEQEVIASEGSVQTTAGQFDIRISAGGSYTRGQRELDVRQVDAGQRSFDRDKGFVKAANEAIDAITDEIAFIREGGRPSSAFIRDGDSVIVIGSVGGELQAGNISQGSATGQGLQNQGDAIDQAILDAAKDLATPEEFARIAVIEEQFKEEGIRNRKFVRHILKENVTAALKRIEKFPPNSILRTDVTTYDLAFIKQFRNGTILRPFVEYVGEEDHLSRRKGQARLNRTEIGLNLTIPLGKGRGYIATAGGEIASEFELEASRNELQHAVSERVFATTSAYWDVVAAQERLSVLLESEMIAATILNLADAMIAQDIIPGVTRAQVVAREGTVRAARIEAEFRLLQAQQALVVAMGYDGDDILRAPLASDPFPPLVPAAEVEAQELEALVRQASFKRADRMAAVQQKIASAVLVDQAEANLKAACDLQLGLSYAGFDEGGQAETLFTPYQEGHAGPAGFFSLRADWPFGNRIPRGELEVFRARGRKLQQTIGIITRSIDSGITTARQQVRNAAVFYAFERAAMEQTRLALQGENEKLRLGVSTVIDSILAEERLTNSRSGLVDARLQQAQGLARLRFETGTILSADQRSAEIAAENLITLPPVELPVSGVTAAEQEEEARKSWSRKGAWPWNRSAGKGKAR